MSNKIRIENLSIEKQEITADKIVKTLGKYPFVKLTSEDKKNVHNALPDPRVNAEFRITNGCNDVANAFRRVLLDELVHPKLTFTFEDMKTTDNYIEKSYDYVISRIENIPVQYFTKDKDIPEWEIDVTNNTSQNMIILSDHIKPKNAAARNTVIAKNIRIIYLVKGCTLNIHIKTVFGTNRKKANYSFMYINKFMATKFGKKREKLDNDDLPNSYSDIPYDYIIGFNTFAFNDPKHIISEVWRTIREKLDKASEVVKEFIDNKKILPYQGVNGKITQKEGGLIKYSFYNETYTLAHLISKYVFLNYPDISVVYANDDRPEEDHIHVIIRDDKHAEKILDAIKTAKSAISDL